MAGDRVEYLTLKMKLPDPVVHSFGLTASQVEKARIFIKTHACTQPEEPGAIGGRIGYKFIPTGVGDLVTVYCQCGAELNITDVDSF